MASNNPNTSDGREMNTSIVSDISALNVGDFDLIIEHLLCKPKKSKRTKRPFHRKIQVAQSVPTLNDNELFRPPDERNENVINATFSGANASFASSLNDTFATINNEQFENIFAYFDEEVTTNDLLVSDDSDSDGGQNSKKASSATNRETKEIQNKSKAILDKIHTFNVVKPRNNAEKSINRMRKSHIQNRPFSTLSTSSTASLHDSDSDTVFKKPGSVVRKGHVQNKVAFFSDQSASDGSTCASPCIQSVSDDDEYQFRRTKSKHEFKQNRDFFENYFKDKHDQSMVDTSLVCTENHPHAKMEKNVKQTALATDHPIDAHDKLDAVRTYVQTKCLLERIQRLVTSISNLDEERLSSMNLQLLKKFLTFIRDCSYQCTQVCNSISQNVLTDFEKNVMSAEELLFSALKGAHENRETELPQCRDASMNISEHQLRVQASLQRLDVPDWFKQHSKTSKKPGEGSNGYVPGSFTKKRNADVQQWTSLNSKPMTVQYTTRPTSHLNSNQMSPSGSMPGLNHNSSNLPNQIANNSVHSAAKPPYLGWRQEKLTQPRTPHERLASSMQQQRQQRQQNGLDQASSLSTKIAIESASPSEIETSIKELTSAIEQCVIDQSNRTAFTNARSRSASPKSKNFWLEKLMSSESVSPKSLLNSFGISATPSQMCNVADKKDKP